MEATIVPERTDEAFAALSFAALKDLIASKEVELAHLESALARVAERRAAAVAVDDVNGLQEAIAERRELEGRCDSARADLSAARAALRARLQVKVDRWRADVADAVQRWGAGLDELARVVAALADDAAAAKARVDQLAPTREKEKAALTDQLAEIAAAAGPPDLAELGVDVAVDWELPASAVAWDRLAIARRLLALAYLIAPEAQPRAYEAGHGFVAFDPLATVAADATLPPFAEAAASSPWVVRFASRYPALLLRDEERVLQFRDGKYDARDSVEIDFLLRVVADEAKSNRSVWLL